MGYEDIPYMGETRIMLKEVIKIRDFLSYSGFNAKSLDLIMSAPVHLIEESIRVEFCLLIPFSKRINFGRVTEVLKTNRKLK